MAKNLKLKAARAVRDMTQEMCIRDSHGEPDIFAALLIRKGEKYTERHADNKLCGNALQ